VGLVEDTSERANRDLLGPRHDDGVSTFRYRTRELYVTPLLADFFKTRGFEVTPDLSPPCIETPSGLSRPNLYLNLAHHSRMRGNRRLVVQFQCFTQIPESLFFSSPLARDIDIQALGNEPFSLAPNDSRKRTLHEQSWHHRPPRDSNGVHGISSKQAMRGHKRV
jgi:hypothetical protein